MVIRDNKGNLVSPDYVGKTVYEYDTHTGLQISVMIGDVLIDEAFYLSFSVNQSKSPVYGWANQYYSFEADGHIIVQGQLAINFKETGYLLYPIKRYIERSAALASTSPRVSVGKKGEIGRFESASERQSFLELSRQARRKKTLRGNVEQSAKWSQSDSEIYRKMQHDFWNEMGRLSDDEFEDWAEAFEDVIWFGSDTVDPLGRDRLFANNLSKNSELDDETVFSHRRPDLYPPVDIWIISGDMSRPSANHTTNKIMDVSFLGLSRTIEVSGEPIAEVYPFFAKNFV